MVDVDDVETEVDCSGHGFKCWLFFSVELRQNDDLVHDSNESLVLDVQVVHDVIDGIELFSN